jgi:glutaredoxin 3
MYRLEFVGGKLVYAVRVDTSTLAAGESVNNCPSDVCQAKEDATRDSGDGNEGTAEGNPEATLATATEHAAALALVTTRAVLYAKASCKWCRRVKEMLDAIQLPYTEFAVGRDVGVAVVEQRAGQPVRTVPQVFIDGVYVGGHDDTVAAIAAGDVVGADPLPTNFSSSVSSDNDDDGEKSTGNAAHLSLGVAVGHCPLTTSSEKFRIMPTDWTHAIVPQLEQLLVANRVDIGAVELVIDAEGDAFVIDWNCCNTNYNQRAEAIAGLENFGAAGECAAFFEAELAKVVVGVSLPSPELPPYVATR